MKTELRSTILHVLVPLGVLAGFVSAVSAKTTDSNPLNPANWTVTSSTTSSWSCSATLPAGVTGTPPGWSGGSPHVGPQKAPYITGVYSTCTASGTCTTNWYVKWTGQGTAPKYVCVNVYAWAEAEDGAGDSQHATDDGQGDGAVMVAPGSGDQPSGATAEYISQGNHPKTLRLNGGQASISLTQSASCTGFTGVPSSSNLCFAGTGCGSTVTVISKGLDISGSNDQSYHRVAGPPVSSAPTYPACSWSENAGDSAVLNGGILGLTDWNCDLMFQANLLGTWSGWNTSPYTHLVWSTDATNATTFAPNYNGGINVVFDYTTDQVLSLLNGPETKNVKVTATDNADGFSAGASYALTVHGPVELLSKTAGVSEIIGWADKLNGGTEGTKTAFDGPYTWQQSSSTTFTDTFSASLTGEVSADATAYSVLSAKFKSDLAASIVITETTDTTVTDTFTLAAGERGYYVVIAFDNPTTVNYSLYGLHGYTGDASSLLKVPYGTLAWKPIWKPAKGELEPQMPTQP